MSYFDDASLVMIPSGYKDQKVYSVKPIDGSGDLTFSRASSATRVNSSGLVEKVRTNESLYSEDYTNAYWTKGFVNLSANSIANPVNGASTATTITPNTSTGSHYLRSTSLAMSANTEVSQSIYAKANGYNYVMLEGYDGSNNPKIIFNLSDGSFSTISASGNPVGSVEALANGWYHLKMTWKTQAGSPNVFQYYFVYDNGSGTSYAGDGTSGAYFFGAQLEYGVPTDYIATTSSAVSVGPVSGLPRLDYSGGASCPSLLLEPQRTNAITFSESFDNAAWTKVRSSITANNTTSPAGYSDADLLVPDTSSNDHFTLRSATASTAQSFSVFAKAGGYNYIFLGADNLNISGVYFNLTNGTISQNTSTLTAKIEDYGNGWYRCAVSSASWPAAFALIATSANGTEIIHTGDGTSGVYIWGAQLEAGAYATSYIPTLSTAVTRVVDLAQKTGASAIIGQTEGSIYWEIDVKEKTATGSDDLLNLDNGGFGDTIYLYKVADGRIACDIFDNSVAQASFILPEASWSVGVVKMALGYANNNCAFFVNGTQVGTTDTSCTIPTMTRIQLGNTGVGPSFNRTKQVLLFTTRLSNADLATLTA